MKSAIQHARGGLPVNGSEAIAIVALLQFAENLQFNLKSTEWHRIGFHASYPNGIYVMNIYLCSGNV